MRVLKEVVDRITALPKQLDFMIHTVDITHSLKAEQLDTAAQLIGSTGTAWAHEC